MNLHHVGKKPDWSRISPKRYTPWQTVAVRTNGIVTPGNLLTIGGALAAVYGAWLLTRGQTFAALLWILGGRLADVADGLAADLTGTKSPLGKVLDASFDKVVALVVLIALVASGLIPLWLAALVFGQNAANTILALSAVAHGVTLQPSREGKLSAFGSWIGLGLFVALPLAPAAYQGTLVTTALVITLLGLFVALRATLGYYDDLLSDRLERGKRVQFERYVVVRNPVSTEAFRADERIATLRHLLPRKQFITLNTTADGHEANRQLLRQHMALLGPKTLLCVAAGDGTVNMLVNALLHDKSLTPEARQTPILPLWCGNGNDLAYMLNGAWSKRKLKRILQNGHVARILPLACTLTREPGNIDTITAAAYASFGATAYASQEIEQALPRKSPIRRILFSRIGQEIIAAARALALAPTFTISQHGQSRTMYERMYINGSRFAKIIGTPLRLTDARFHRGIIEHKHPVAIALHLLGLLNAREVTKRAITHDTFRCETSVWAQFDGEPMHVAAGTDVAIAISDQPFYALSVRLR